jgi:hypothetical protein
VSAVGRLVAVNKSSRTVREVPCRSAEMVHPGWMRLVLGPDADGSETVSWWRVTDDVTTVEWQSGASE